MRAMITTDRASRGRSMMTITGAILLVIAFSATGCSVNRSLRVDDGETISRSLTTVNGSITVGSDCEVKGGCRTVNGSIDVDSRSSVMDLQTVNGSVELGSEVKVNGDVETVNGRVECGDGTEVDGDVSNVNGRIRLRGTTVHGSVSSHTGSIRLEGSTIKEDVIIGHSSGGRHKPLEIEIVRGSIVEGDVDARDSSRKVIVFVDSESEVRGDIRGAELADDNEAPDA